MENFWEIVKEHRWRVILYLSVLLFLYLLFAYLVPSVKELLQLEHAIRENNRRIQEVEEWQEKSVLLKAHNRKLKKQLDQLLFNYRQPFQVSAIMSFLNQAAEKSGIDFLTIKPQKKKVYKRHQTLPIQLEINACYHSLARFINNLETSSILIKIERLRIFSQSMVSNQLRVEMTISVYYQEHSDEAND